MQQRKIGFLALCLLPGILSAFPQSPKVVFGEASFFQEGSEKIVVETSDRAIINYEEFNVGSNETVEFLQPSSRSTVLNRVTGKSPSEILGNVTSNGSVFLVNPYGVYFGPTSTVDTGSLIVSTLDIADVDFIEGKFAFKKGSFTGGIENKGLLVASDGVIAFLSPKIKNEGIIRANAEKVVFASGEAITLTFEGDGLMSFQVEEEATKALIEHLGSIESKQVFLQVGVAQQAIKQVINQDGILEGVRLIKENGRVKISSGSTIKAEGVYVESPGVLVEGTVDVSSTQRGGEVHFLGDHLELSGALIDASGDLGGGTVLIGGEYKGSGPFRNAITNVFDNLSVVKADSLQDGDGGRVIVWADGITIFNGYISVEGGKQSGNGGFIETSGQYDLRVGSGMISALAPHGKLGSWLLDPTTLTIVSGASGALPLADCFDATNPSIGTTTIDAVAGNVILCATSTITQNTGANIQMNTSGASLSFTTATTVTLNATIQTTGGDVSFTPNVVLGSGITNYSIDTTFNSTATGASVSFNGTLEGTGAGTRGLTVNGGTGGTVTFTGNVGAATALLNLTATAATVTQSGTARAGGAVSYTAPTAINLQGNITTAGGAVTLTGPIAIANTPSIDTTNSGSSGNGANISYSGTVNGATSLASTSGLVGTVTFTGVVGGSAPPTALTFGSCNSIRITTNITLSGANSISTSVPVVLLGPVTLTMNNNAATFSGGINGNFAFSLVTGTGGGLFSGTAIGGTTPLASLSVQASSGGFFQQNTAVNTVGSVTYTTPNSPAMSVSGNITTQGGAISFSNAVGINGSSTFNTTNTVAAGNNITFTGAVSGSSPLSLNGGTSGTVLFNSTVAFTGASGSVTVTAGTITQSSTLVTTLAAAVSLTATSAININGNITTGGGAVTFAGPVVFTGARSITTNSAAVAGAAINFSTSTTTIDFTTSNTLTFVAGTGGLVSFNGAVGATVAPTNMTFTSSGGIRIGANITVTGANTLTFLQAVTMIGTSTITSNNANIGFSNTLNGAQALTIAGGTGTTTFSGIIGGTTPLTSLSVTSATITQSLAATLGSGGLSYTGSSSITGTTITTSSGPILFTGPVSFTLGKTLTTNSSGSGASITFSGSTSTINFTSLNNLVFAAGTGIVSFGGIVGGTTPPNNISFTSSGGIQIGANISVQATGTFNQAVTLTAPSTITATTIGGIITFSSTVDGAQALTVVGGTSSGTVTFTGAVGSVTPLSSISVTSPTINQNSSMALSGTHIYVGSTVSNVGGDLTTSGGTVTFTGPVVFTGARTITTNNTAPLGAAIAFIGSTSTIGFSVSNTLTFVAGSSGAIVFGGIIGGGTAPSNLIFTSSGGIFIGANITVTGANPLIFGQAVALTAAATITSNGANINFSSTLDGAQVLTLAAGAGTVAFSGAVGGITPLTNLIFSSSAAIQIGANITTNSVDGTLTFPSPVTMTGTSTITSNNANILFSTTLGGAQALTIAGGFGTTTFTGAVGGTPLSSLAVTSATINQSSAAQTTGALSYTGSTSINISGDITTSAGAITMTGPVVLTGALTFITTSSSPGGGAINFSGSTSTVNFSLSNTLTLDAGTSGNITFSAPVGNLVAPSNLTTSANTIQVASDITVSGSNALAFTSPVVFTGASTITSNSANISFSNTVNGAQAVTFIAGTGTVAFSGIVGAVNPPTNLIFSSSGGIQIGANMTVSGANTFSFPQAVTLTGASVLTSNSANISFSSTINGNQNLSFTAGTGLVIFSAAVGGTTPPTSLIFTSSGGIQVGASITVASSVAFAQAVSLTATSTITSNSGSIAFNTTLDGAQTLTIAAGSGTTTFTGAVGATAPLTSLLVTSSTITQSSTVQTTGALSYAGSTAINVSGNITTNAGAILVAGPVTFTGARTLTTNNILTIGANISFVGSTSTVDFLSSNTLTFIAGTSGIVSFNGIVGSGTAPTNLIFTSAAAIEIGANITVTGSNPLTFPFPVTLTASPTITSNGANINFSSTLNGAHVPSFAAGGGIVTFSGIVGGTTPPTNLIFTSSGGIQVGADITVSGANTLTFAQAVTLTGGSTITSNDANITFSSTLNGSRALTLEAGVGTVTFSLAVGGTTPLTSLIVRDGTLVQSSTMAVTGSLLYVNSVQATIGGAISANSIGLVGAGTALFQANATATSTFISTSPITFNTSLTLTAPSGITLSTAIPTADGVYNLSLNATGGTITATQLGSPTEYINILTLSALFFDIGAIYANNVTNLIFENIIAPGANLVFSFPTTVEDGTFTINVTGGSAAGSVTFQSTLDGPGGLTFILGSGDLAFDDVVGGITPLGDITVASAGDVDIADSFTARSFTQSSGSGTTTLSGAMITSSNVGISMTGNIFTINGTLTTTGLGPVFFNNTGLLTLGAVVDSSGSFSQTGTGAVSLGANITTINDQTFTGPVTLTATVILDSSAGAGDITFGSSATINGAQSLSFVADTGTVSLLGAVGGVTPLTNLAFTSAGLIKIGSNITTTVANPLVFSAAVELVGTSIITSNNANVTFASTIDGTYGLTVAGGTGTVTFSGAVGDAPLAELVVTAASIVQSGEVLTIGRVSYTAASISIGGDITTSRGNITMTGPVTLTADAVFDTTDNLLQLFGADITFSSTLNGAFSLTLDAGTAGIITFSGNVGSGTALTNLAFTGAKQIQVGGNITVTAANPLEFAAPVLFIAASTITSNGANITFDSTLDGTHALSIQGGAGTLTFTGAVGSKQRSTSLSATSANIVQTGSVASAGAVSYVASSSVTTDGNITAGSFTQSGGGTVALGASIIATSSITIAGAITFDASISLTAAGSGGITVSTMTPTISGAYNLTLSALGGVITATQLGSSSAYIDVLNLAAKALSVGSIYANTIIDNGALTISSDIIAPGAYLVFPNPTTVATGVYTLDVTGGVVPGKISFASTLDGPGSLLFMVGDGNLNFDGFIGSIVDFGDLAIDSAQNVTVSKTFTGSSFTQAAGGGTTTLVGTVTTSSSTGVSLTGTIMNITGSIFTGSAGPVTFDNSGLLTISGSINANGNVTQSGTGGVSLANTITTTNATAADAAVSFAGEVTLTGEVEINTSIGGGDITFGSSATIDGLQNLALGADSGSISFGGAIGQKTPIGALTVYNVADLTLPLSRLSSFSQIGGSGTTTIDGAMTATGDLGIVIVGNDMNINATIQTLGKGSIILQNEGTLTLDASAEINAAGEFLQTGSGDANISGNVSAR